MSNTTPLSPSSDISPSNIRKSVTTPSSTLLPLTSYGSVQSKDENSFLLPQSYYPGPSSINLDRAMSTPYPYNGNGQEVFSEDINRYLLANARDTLGNIDSINFETKQIKGHLGSLRKELDDLDDAIDSLDTKVTKISQAIDVPSQIALQRHPTYFLLMIFLFFLVIALWQDVFIKTIGKLFGKKDLGIVITVVIASIVSIILWIVIVKGGTNLFSVESKI